VQEFEQQFLSLLHAEHGALLKAIRDEKALSDASEKKLVEILDAFVKRFA
jgi:F-type H+-transporting ATPase subunit alpha